MIKTFKKISIAAAALMMVACSSQDTAENRPAAGRQVQFTATIAAPNSATRTAYSEVTTGDAAGTIDVAWKAGDKIALIHNAVKDVVEVEAVNADGSATITGTITVGTDGEKVEVCYPAALWDWDNTTSGAIRNATFVTNINAQDGTLGYIQDNLDARMGAGTLKVSGDKATLSANVTLASQIAIWKLNLQDNAPTPAALQATKVTMKVDGTPEPATIASTTTLGTATSTLYLGLDKFANQKIIIEATVGSDTYKYEKEGVSLALGKYYQSTVTMAPQGYAANEYNEGSWDSNNKKVVFTKQAAASVTALTNKNTGDTWSAGWYTVSGNVTITGDVTLIAETHLILQDDAVLTINGKLIVGNNNLYIYGQKKGDGKLNVNNSGNAIYSKTGYRIDIHGGEVTAAATGDFKDGLFTGFLAVYGGKLTATSGGGNGIGFYNTIDVYDGEVVATSNATSSSFPLYGISSGGDANRILKVYGGKVTATGNGVVYGSDYGSGFGCYVWSGTSGIKFYFSDNGTTWGPGLGYGIAAPAPGNRYAKAE